MKRMPLAFLLIAGVIGAVGCRSALIAGADYDRNVLIGQPATFAWAAADGLPVGDPRLDANPWFESRLHGVIAREFAARGIRMAVGARKPTLLVHYHASVQDHVEVLTAEETSPAMSPYGPGTQVYQYEEGNFIVDVVDARTDLVIWRGWARVDLMGTLDEPDAFDELLVRAVDRMFGFFPIPEGTPVNVDDEQEEPMIEPVPDIEELPMPDVADGASRPRPDVELERR